MKYNSFLDNLTMTANYRSWEPLEDETLSLTFRNYGEQQSIRCQVTVSPVGSVSLYAKERLKTFGIVQDIADSVGNSVMDGIWYSVQKVTPVLDASGSLSSYRHVLAILDPSLVRAPIEPIVVYPDIDQQQW